VEQKSRQKEKDRNAADQSPTVAWKHHLVKSDSGLVTASSKNANSSLSIPVAPFNKEALFGR
jgi:hypothetical protein